MPEDEPVDSPEEEEADDEPVDSPCATLVTEIWEHGLGNKDVITLDDVSEAIDTGFAEGNLSTQEANHWFNRLSDADQDYDNLITEADLVDACMAIGVDEFNFGDDPEDAEFVGDHTIDDLVEDMGIKLDKDSNGDINLWHASYNLPPYVEDGTLTQEEADTYWSIIEGALAVPGNDYKGDDSVLLTDIRDYLIDNNY